MRKVPEIKTSLPGPKSQEILKRDKKYISPSYARPYPVVIHRGEGIWVFDVDGNRFMDLNAGIAVLATGHSHPEIVKTAYNQMRKLIHMSGTDFYYEEQVDLAEKLAEIVPGAKNKRSFLTNSGTESIEAAMKLARYKTHRPIFISFFNAFHGRSLGALSLTASKAVHRRWFSPMLPQVVHIPFPNPYRPPFGVKREDVSDSILNYLEEEVFKKLAPPEEVAAFFAEPIQGEGGYIVPPDDFFPKLKKTLEKYDILFICDEIQSGMGRTGKFFAIEHWGVIPDIVAIAKGIASGFPLGACVAKSSLMDWEPGSHANTFGGNPVSCGVSLKTIELLEGGLIDNADKMGKMLIKALREIQLRFELIGDVRGKGLMIGCEIVKDREKKIPDKKMRDRILMESFKRGLLLLGAGESIIRWSPPLIIKKENLEVALEIFEESLRSVIGK